MNHPTLMTIAELSNYKETGRLEEVERLTGEMAVLCQFVERRVECISNRRGSEGRVQ